MAANPLTDYDRLIIREMWTEEWGFDEIAVRLNRTHATIQYAGVQMGLGPKPKKVPNIWRSEVVAALVKAWMEGHTGTSCAKILRKDFGISITRMSVIGKVHRLGLKRGPEVNRINCNLSSDGMGPARAMLKQSRSQASGKYVARVSKKAKPAPTHVPNPKASYGADDNIREAWVIVTDAAWDILPGSEPKTLLNRGNFGECKYPVGINEPEQRFCCVRTAQTYCDAHRAVMYRPPTKGERDTLRPRHIMRAAAR